MHVCVDKLRMINRTWCRRVGNKYDATMRTKQRSIGPQRRQRRLHDKNKMTIDEGKDDVFFRWRPKAVLTKTKRQSIEAIQTFDRTSRGQLVLDDNRSNDGNNSTNKNDEGATCRRGQWLQTKMLIDQRCGQRLEDKNKNKTKTTINHSQCLRWIV
jgi:hypothetical protein